MFDGSSLEAFPKADLMSVYEEAYLHELEFSIKEWFRCDSDSDFTILIDFRASNLCQFIRIHAILSTPQKRGIPTMLLSSSAAIFVKLIAHRSSKQQHIPMGFHRLLDIKWEIFYIFTRKSAFAQKQQHHDEKKMCIPTFFKRAIPKINSWGLK